MNFREKRFIKTVEKEFKFTGYVIYTHALLWLAEYVVSRECW